MTHLLHHAWQQYNLTGISNTMGVIFISSLLPIFMAQVFVEVIKDDRLVYTREFQDSYYRFSPPSSHSPPSPVLRTRDLHRCGPCSDTRWRSVARVCTPRYVPLGVTCGMNSPSRCSALLPKSSPASPPSPRVDWLGVFALSRSSGCTREHIMGVCSLVIRGVWYRAATRAAPNTRAQRFPQYVSLP